MVSKVTKKLDLRNYPGFSELDPDIKGEIKEAVGTLVEEFILDYVGEGKSPVSGRKFKGLSAKYKEVKGKQSSSVIPNLELTGEMLDSLESRPYRYGVEVGIFDSNQAPKAENHNFGVTLPKRQFIPTNDEKFVGAIEKEIKDLIKEYNGQS